jgi:hypothetical protein
MPAIRNLEDVGRFLGSLIQRVPGQEQASLAKCVAVVQSAASAHEAIREVFNAKEIELEEALGRVRSTWGD